MNPKAPQTQPSRPWPFVLRTLAALGLVVASTASAAPPFTFSAAHDFRPVKGGDFVDYYTETRAADRAEHGVAIRTPQHHGRAAAAEIAFSGPAGRYHCTLLAVAEEDGESVYRLFIGERDMGERRNPFQAAKRTRVEHSWNDITLEPGTVIRVVFAGHTNGRIPEGSGTAWSRGRWRSLRLSVNPPSDHRAPPTIPPHAETNP